MSVITLVFGTRAKPSPLMKAIAIAFMAVVSLMAAAVYGALWLVSFRAAVLITTHVVAFFAGLAWRDRRRATTAEQSGYLEETVEAKNLADAAADGRHINTNPDGKTLFGAPPSRPVPFYDWAAEDDTPATLPRSIPGAYGRFWR